MRNKSVRQIWNVPLSCDCATHVHFWVWQFWFDLISWSSNSQWMSFVHMTNSLLRGQYRWDIASQNLFVLFFPLTCRSVPSPPSYKASAVVGVRRTVLLLQFASWALFIRESFLVFRIKFGVKLLSENLFYLNPRTGALLGLIRFTIGATRLNVTREQKTGS